MKGIWRPSRESKHAKIMRALLGEVKQLKFPGIENITKEWIESIPKDINPITGCWIPKSPKPESNGYVRVGRADDRYLLHRLVVCIYYNLDYNDDSFVSRHSTNCIKACFLHSHLKPGSASENSLDSVRDGTHHHARKEACGTCGTLYDYTSGRKNGHHIVRRVCKNCISLRDKERYRLNKLSRND